MSQTGLWLGVPAPRGVEEIVNGVLDYIAYRHPMNGHGESNASIFCSTTVNAISLLPDKALREGKVLRHVSPARERCDTRPPCRPLTAPESAALKCEHVSTRSIRRAPFHTGHGHDVITQTTDASEVSLAHVKQSSRVAPSHSSTSPHQSAKTVHAGGKPLNHEWPGCHGGS